VSTASYYFLARQEQIRKALTRPVETVGLTTLFYTYFANFYR